MDEVKLLPCDDDVRRRLLSVAMTLETCGKHGIPIDFALLAHDIRAALSRPTTVVTDEVVERVARAIWHAQWEEAWPREGGIEHAHALEVARSALAAVEENGNAHSE